MNQEKRYFDWHLAGSMLACILLGGGLFLFIRNNALFANGARNLWHIESLIILGLLGVLFVLTLLHVVRGIRQR